MSDWRSISSMRESSDQHQPPLKSSSITLYPTMIFEIFGVMLPTLSPKTPGISKHKGMNMDLFLANTNAISSHLHTPHKVTALAVVPPGVKPMTPPTRVFSLGVTLPESELQSTIETCVSRSGTADDHPLRHSFRFLIQKSKPENVAELCSPHHLAACFPSLAFPEKKGPQLRGNPWSLWRSGSPREMLNQKLLTPHELLDQCVQCLNHPVRVSSLPSQEPQSNVQTTSRLSPVCLTEEHFRDAEQPPPKRQCINSVASSFSVPESAFVNPLVSIKTQFVLCGFVRATVYRPFYKWNHSGLELD